MVRALLVVLALLVAVVVLRALAATKADDDPAGAPAPPGPATSAAPSPGGISPARIRVPGIEVDAAVVDLGLEPDRTLEVPEDTGTAGWRSGGSRPGAAG